MIRNRGFLRTHALLITLITLLTVLAALAAAKQLPTKYQAVASVMVRTQALPSGGVVVPDMATEKEIVLSGNVEQRAQDLLFKPDPNLSNGLTVGVPVDSDVIDIVYTAASPGAALSGASAYTRAYVDYRNELAAGAAGRNDVPDVAEVISPATKPTAPVGHPYPLIVGLSLMMGLGLALAVSLLRDHVTGRVRDSAHVGELLGQPVLGSVLVPTREDGESESDEGVAAVGSGSEVYGLAAAGLLETAGGGRNPSLLVTSPTAGAATSLVSASIAGAMAKAGRETVLIRIGADAPLPTDGPGAHHEGPVVRVPTQISGLSLIDVPADASELDVIHRIRNQKPGVVVVIDGEPLLGSEMTPLLARAVTSVVVAVDATTVTTDDLEEAGQVLAGSSKVLGCVIFEVKHSWWRRVTRRKSGHLIVPDLRPAQS